MLRIDTLPGDLAAFRTAFAAAARDAAQAADDPVALLRSLEAQMPDLARTLSDAHSAAIIDVARCEVDALLAEFGALEQIVRGRERPDA